MALTVVLNGHARDFSNLELGATLSDLVASLQLKPDRIALEHNGEIAPRTAWPSVQLGAGDRVELVHFVGGGL